MIWNLGSINVDHFYGVGHLPKAGETVTARTYAQGLGGKGANMSVAAARGGARVAHIGAIGRDSGWIRNRLLEYGVEVSHVTPVEAPTGQAVVCVEEAGENAIVVLPGANHELTEDMIGAALSNGRTGDILLMQNETNGQEVAARLAKTLGLRVAYAAAPFDASAVQAVLPDTDLLVLNEVEAAQLEAAVGVPLHELSVPDIVVTLGARGCKWFGAGEKQPLTLPAYAAEVVDTTGAGDTFTGFLVAALDRGEDMRAALDLALRAASLMVARQGTADVIPDLKEIQDSDFG